MTKDELKLALKHAKRDERHLSNAETRYWCDQYKLLATQTIEALANDTSQEHVAKTSENVHKPVAYLCENAVGHKYFRWKKPSSIYKPVALYKKENT